MAASRRPISPTPGRYPSGVGTGDPLSEDAFGDDDPNERPARPPLPQDDRLWRHPSEIGRAVAVTLPAKGGHSRGIASAALAGAVVGLFTAAVVLVLSSALLPGSRPAPQATTTRITTPSPRVSIDKALLQSAIARVAPSVVEVRVASSKGVVSGSGLVVSSNGLVLTASGLVGRHRHVSVVLPGKGTFRGVVKGSDRETGLVLVAIPVQGLTPAPLAPSPPVPGQLIMAVTSGSHHGVSTRVGVGSVRSVAQPLQMAHTVLIDTTQVDVPLAPNGAGGVLIDRNGWIVGITLLSSKSANGTLTTAVPVSLVTQDAVQLARLGHPLRGWLGVMGTPVGGRHATGSSPAASGSSPAPAVTSPASGGVEVTQVVSGSPAAAAGIHAGDVIEAVNGQSVTNMAALEQAVRLLAPGSKVTLEVARSSGELTVPAVLAEAQH